MSRFKSMASSPQVTPISQENEGDTSKASQNYEVLVHENCGNGELPFRTSELNYVDFIAISSSIFFYVSDIFFDIYLVYFYYTSDQNVYFWLTLAFLIIPMIVTSLFSLVWYNRDSKKDDVPTTKQAMWVTRIIFASGGMAPLLRYITAFIYGVKSYKAIDTDERKKYYKLMKKEDVDFTFLRLFEAFLEAALQVTLQLVIILKEFDSQNNHFKPVETIRIIFALISLGWAITGFNRASRLSEEKEINPTLETAHVIHLVWHICTISACVFALAIFASAYPLAMIIASFIHWIFMLIWLSVQDCQQKSTWTWDGNCLKLITAFIYIFTFFSLQSGRTRYFYSLFYSIILIENVGMVLTCLGKYELVTSLSILIGDVILFLIGIVFMLIYYKIFHPTVGDLTICKLNYLPKREDSRGNARRENIANILFND